MPLWSNVLEEFHHPSSNRLSVKHPVREQSRFEIHIERFRANEQMKEKKKVYANIDSRLKSIVLSGGVSSSEE
jgi:hypothetical protein